MDVSEYYQQLQIINDKLQITPEGSEKEELLGLKCSIEELLVLANQDNEELPKDQQSNNEIDDEYALFMAEMAKEGAVSNERGTIDVASTQHKLQKLEGKKIRAPHKHQWGQVVYHNAMICSVLNENPSNEEFEVRVLFLNPTHKEMLPCPYYFDMDRDCNFSEEQCHFSHGELVPFSSLQEYIEPNFESLAVGSHVFAKRPDNLWYRAKITEISKKTCWVQFDSKNIHNEKHSEVIFEHILPLEDSEDNSDDDSEDMSESENTENAELATKAEREQLINMSLMTVPDSQALGAWEKHTKGIGSKLMQKMGYIVGTGLGKQGEGIIKPVTALILPQGKSLDFCMNLKEQHNNPHLFHADKKMPKRERKVKGAKKGHNRKKHVDLDAMNIQEYFKWAISTIRPKLSETESLKVKQKLKSATEKDLNLVSFTVEESLKKLILNKGKLETTIKGFHDRGQTTPKTLLKKLHYKDIELTNLNAYVLLIKSEMNRKKNNKEMAVF